MLTHERLVEEVASRARLPETADAVRAVKITVAAVAHRVDLPLRQRLRRALPGPERDAAYATVPTCRLPAAELPEEAAPSMRTSPARAGFLVRTVLTVIAEQDPDLGRALRDGLGPAYAEFFVPVEAHPERVAAAGDGPVPLDERQLRVALRRRPGWQGDGHRLTRTVGLPADRFAPLVRQVEKDAHDLRHHVRHTRAADGITFTLTTRSLDAVTAVDLAMADRIDAAVDAVGSGGRPGR